MKKMTLLWAMILLSSLTYAQQIIDSTQVDSSDEIPVHLREIPRHNLIISGGILQPMGDYGDISKSGLNIQLGYERYFNKNIGLSAAIGHSYNEFYSALSEEETVINNTANNFTKTTLELGGVYTVRDNRFQFDSFLRGGISFLNNPVNEVVETSLTGNTILLSSNNDVSNDSAFSATVGVRFNYYFRKQVQLFFSPMYSTTMGDSIVYNDALGRTINANMSNLNFNIGIKIALGKTYSNGEQRAADLQD
jgi:hypothetical protein